LLFGCVQYQTQKKKAEKEEQRLRQKKAREDFLTMLQQSTLLTATTRWR
jgi:pre-mRNA-processing factor 40